MDGYLTTIATDGGVPANRLQTANAAYNKVCFYINNDQLRSQKRASIDGLFDGNAPYTREELNKKNRRDAVNINWKQATAILNMIKAAYYNLWSEIPFAGLPEITVGTDDQKTSWATIIAQGFQRMLNRWSKWEFVKQNHQLIMMRHGIGFVFWPDNMDWRPDTGNAGDLLVADGSPSNIEELQDIVILKTYTADQLYTFIANEQAATDMGWDVDNVKEAIATAYSGGDNPPQGAQTWEWYQSKLKEGDIYAGGYMFDRIACANILVREFYPNEKGNQISRYIITYANNAGKFLFRRDREFKTMSNTVCPFFFDIGQGKWHSINGLGKEIFPYIQTFNRMLCELLQAAQIAGSAIMQPETAQAAQIAQMITFSGMTIMPPGWKIVEHSIGENLQAIMRTIDFMTQNLINNIGSMMKSPVSQPRKGQKISIMEMQQQGELMKTNIYHYYPQCDFMLTEMMMRAARATFDMPGGAEAVEMRQWCEYRGVPPEVWKNIAGMRMCRSLGAGSAANEQMKLEGMKELLPELPPEGRNHVLRMITSRLVGTDETSAIFGTSDEDEEQRSNDSIAVLENNDIRRGEPVVISQGQDDVIHSRIHLADASVHLKQSQEQAQQEGEYSIQNLQSLYVHLTGTGQHVHDHLERIKDNPIDERDYKELLTQWKQMGRALDQITNNLKEKMQAQQNQPQQPQKPPFNPKAMAAYDKDLPESSKQQLLIEAGIPPQNGDVSATAQNQRIKEYQTQLKAERAKALDLQDRQKALMNDLATKREEEMHRKQMDQPSPAVNGNN